ncbi:hypothetical protein VTO42DRAFT_7496 [Malbranchea cinnamomea]
MTTPLFTLNKNFFKATVTQRSQRAAAPVIFATFSRLKVTAENTRIYDDLHYDFFAIGVLTASERVIAALTCIVNNVKQSSQFVSPGASISKTFETT